MTECVIGGLFTSEILDMTRDQRAYWYRKISPEEREMAMQVVGRVWRIKISESKTGENNPTKRAEVRAKISAALREINRQRWQDPDFKTKMCKIMNSQEYRAKVAEATRQQWQDPEYRKSMTGENNPNWRGGISFEPYGVEFNDELKSQIRERDDFTCQACHQAEEELGFALGVHHIDYDKQNNNPENLISLCRSCHAQTNYNREEWIEYFRG